MSKKERKGADDEMMRMKEEIVQIASISHMMHLSAGIGSNYSVRLAKDEMMITRSGINKAWLKPDDLLHVRFNGEMIAGEGKVSSEFPMHVWIYKDLDDAGAIIHSNPPHLTAFAVAGKGLDTAHLTEPYLQIGDYIPLVHYATPSTGELATMFKPYLQSDRKVYLMQNHGVVVVGKNIVDAYNNLAMAENYAHIMSMFGLPQAKVLDKNDLALLNKTFK